MKQEEAHDIPLPEEQEPANTEAQTLRLPGVCIEQASGEELINLLNKAGLKALSIEEEISRLHQQEEELCDFILKGKTGTTLSTSGFDIKDESTKNRDYWFIGDIHGDLTALLTVMACINAHSEKAPRDKPMIVFLGDVFDRGNYNREVINYIIDLSQNPRFETIILKGNHDIALGMQENGQFYSSVTPANFVDELNGMDEKAALYQKLGLATIALFDKQPAALILDFKDEAVLCTHGGVPHSDLLAIWNDSTLKFSEIHLDKLLQKRMEEDFMWTRIHPTARFKRPNRSSMGCQSGIRNVEEFLALLYEKDAINISMILRGHEHEDTGCKHYTRHQNVTIATINTMCASESHPDRLPCLAHWKKGQSLTIHMVTPPSLFKPSE